jgi:hypothetical protein
MVYLINRFQLLISLITLLFLAACTGRPLPVPQSESPQVVKIGLPPTLAHLKAQIATCANSDLAYDILLLEKNSQDWIREPVDLIITFQDAVPGSTYTYLIGQTEISIIAGSEFPLKSLSNDQLRILFNADTTDDQQAGLPAGFKPVIWGFEQHSDMSELFAAQYLFTPYLPDDAYLAVSPQSMVENIAQSNQSIGYTLSSAVTDEVYRISISDVPEASIIPIIASFKLPPSPMQESLIRCLQNQTE